jgi:invasion protein IalB
MMFSIVYGMMMAVAGQSQQAAVAQAPSAAAANKPIERFGDWSLVCADRPNIPPCEVVQAATRKDSNEQVMRFSVAYAGSGDRYAIQFQVPLGISVQGDILIRLDDKTDLPGYRVNRCDTDGCFIEKLSDRAGLDPFFMHGKGVIALADRAGKPIVMPLSFNGFAQAMSAMTARNTAWAKAVIVAPQKTAPAK